MWQSVIGWLIPAAAALVGATAWLAWLAQDPASALERRIPGLDGAPDATNAPAGGRVAIGSHFRASDGVPSLHAESWPRFRGPRGDNRADDPEPLATRWDSASPVLRWEVQLGEGHAGAAIHAGRVYVLDYDETHRRDLLRCLSLDDGRECWQRGYAIEVPRNHGMSRTIPAVTDRHVVTLGPRGHVMCVRADSGDLLWGIDLAQDYGATVPMWYAGQCPLIENEVAILAPAGPEVLLMGVDCATGAVLWRTPNPHALAMSHASLVPATFCGVRMVLYAALGGMVGVCTEPGREGELLWFTPDWDRSVVAPSPVVCDDDLIFATAGYGAGGILLQVSRTASGVFRVETLQQYPSSKGFASEQQTPVLADGHLFGVLPNDAGPLRNQLVCVHPASPGAVVWSSGRDRRFGLGPYLLAGDKLLALSDNGVLTMLEASSSGYREVTRKTVFDAHEAWSPMALAGGLLVLRDATRMLCLDLRANPPPQPRLAATQKDTP